MAFRMMEVELKYWFDDEYSLFVIKWNELFVVLDTGRRSLFNVNYVGFYGHDLMNSFDGFSTQWCFGHYVMIVVCKWRIIDLWGNAPGAGIFKETVPKIHHVSDSWQQWLSKEGLFARPLIFLIKSSMQSDWANLNNLSIPLILKLSIIE